MLNTDEAQAGGSGDDNGGTSSSGTGGRGGTGAVSDGGSYGIGGSASPAGGSYGKGGTTSPGVGGSTTPGKGGTYGYGGTYGKGGGPGKGGTYGKGGSAGYPMMTGGAYPYGGYGATSPGYGGTSTYGGRVGRGGSGGTGYSGRPSYGGTVGKGGRGGSAGFGEAGEAGAAGGGIGGVGGSPAVIAACEDACNNLPSSCPDYSNYNECMSGCVPLSGQYPQCALELADYLNCLAANLSPGAACMVDPSGGCYGQGCLSTAQDACQYWLDTFSTCASGGCGTGYGVGPGYCSSESSCPTHEHQTECTLYDSSNDFWQCTCTVDSALVFQTTIQGYGTETCRALSDACNLAQ
jgi:hypothetical protein